MGKNIISAVKPGSIAEEMELRRGDELLGINGREIEDIFDYRYMVEDENLTLLVRKADGEEWELEIEKDEDEDLGLEFENGLLDDYRSCRNHCIFCFIDQMPRGMRKSLYFKDDDARLSFLQGNYITLTNLSDRDIDRIIRYNMSPVNISFHTTDPQLRCRMLRNSGAGEALKRVDALYEAGIEMNGQIVLCRGINDGERLESTIRDLMRYRPVLRSVSVVPVGLTRFRDGLFRLEPFTAADAAEVIDRIESFQESSFKESGLHFIHAADEFYCLSGREIPEAGRYDGYIQYENGVGMIRSFMDEFDEEYGRLFAGKIFGAKTAGGGRAREVSVATGELMGVYIEGLAGRLMEALPGLVIHTCPIRNDFFGGGVTVSGLLTGRDIIAQMKDRPLGECLLLPANLLRAGTEVLLDDMTLTDISEALGVPVQTVPLDGGRFIQRVCFGL